MLLLSAGVPASRISFKRKCRGQTLRSSSESPPPAVFPSESAPRYESRSEQTNPGPVSGLVGSGASPSHEPLGVHSGLPVEDPRSDAPAHTYRCGGSRGIGGGQIAQAAPLSRFAPARGNHAGAPWAGWHSTENRHAAPHVAFTRINGEAVCRP